MEKKKDWYKVEIRELIRKNLGKIHRKVGDSYGIDVSYLHKMISDYATQELSKAREEVLLELLEKKTNYKIEEVGHGYKVTQEYVLVSDIEKELSKLSNK